MDKQPNFFNFMHGASKAVIIIPLIILGLAIIFKATELPFLHAKVSVIPTPAPTAIPTSSAPKKIKLDLNGPLVCDYTENNQSIKAYIKDKNVSVQMAQGHGENLLVKGDCFYKWEPNKFTGEKTCGISTYIGLFQTMSSLGGGLDLSSLFSLTQLGNNPEASVSATFIQNTVNSCEKQEVDVKVFTIPTNVSFKETAPAKTSGQSGSSGGIGDMLKLLGK